MFPPAGVDFIVVGGVAAVLHGVPVTTFDLDVVHCRSDGNVTRLMAALAELDACYRSQPARRLQPQESHLKSPGHQLLITKFGPLDLLSAIGDGLDYPRLLPQCVKLTLTSGMTLRVLSLAALIKIKEELGRDKDSAALPVLRHTLEERENHEE